MKVPFEYTEEYVGKPKYKGYIANSTYITVRDGVKIAAEVYLPKGLEKNEKVPAILVQTRYWRAYRFRIPFKWFMEEPRKPKVVKVFTTYGFAVVWTDVRGTGCSEGTRSYPFSEAEIMDSKDIIDWIIKQDWSDGNVVTYGNSYEGTTSELTISLGHPALKAAVVRHNPWDFYLHAVYPGGVFNEKFIMYWSNLGKELDQTKGKAVLEMKPYNPTLAKIAYLAVKGVKPINLKDIEDLKRIAKIHEKNRYPIDYFEKVNYRDDQIGDNGPTIDDISIFSKKEAIENSKVPIYSWGSWQDSTTANATILRFLNFSNSQKAIISDWCHRDKNRASPFHKPKSHASPNEIEQLKDLVKFYRDCLKNEFKSEKVLYYYTMGEEKWKKTYTWPPKNQIMKRWYLHKDNLLSIIKPDEKEGSDSYKIDFNSTTGIRNRWYTLLSLPVKYLDREQEDEKLLVYTSNPIEEDIEITGHPIVNIFMKTTHQDGIIHIHFEFLDRDDKIHWITDGQLRLIHRKISEKEPPYKMITPYHSFNSNDILPVEPNEIMEIKFALYPTSIVLPKGTRLRIAIGGADKDTFTRYPKEGDPTITIERNKQFASYIDFPIIEK